MIKKAPNIPASIHTRLLSEAKRVNKPFGEILQYYGMERFLNRLSKTSYADKLILKGGLLFYCWDLPFRRFTKDIDFRGYVSNTIENIAGIIRDVSRVSMPEDGLYFDVDTLKLIEIQEDANNVGVRANIVGYLGKSEIHLQIDISFSDQITPGIVDMEYPCVLSNMVKTKLKGYPPETVISEKFQAMVHLGDINSRMKDYYDVWLLLKSCEYDYRILQQAIETTFKIRSTKLPVNRPTALTREFAVRNQGSWDLFLKRNKIDIETINDFSNVLDEIWSFLKIPIEGINVGSIIKKRRWIPSKGWG
jgi:predicted nucleotidyltransferase component of viral defense system